MSSMRRKNNDTCKYFNGAFHNKVCCAGVEYSSTDPHPGESGSFLRLPCKTAIGFEKPSEGQIAQFARRGTCDKFELPTDAEFEAHETEVERLMRESILRIVKAGPLIEQIRNEHKGKSANGNSTCPACGGILRWSISGYNGHVHMNCATDECISFME